MVKRIWITGKASIRTIMVTTVTVITDTGTASDRRTVIDGNIERDICEVTKTATVVGDVEDSKSPC
jgi:hypothetical protein